MFWLLGATGHAKNFSIWLAPGGRFRLTPLYEEALSALPKGFPEKIGVSITDGAKRRLKALALPDGQD